MAERGVSTLPAAAAFRDNDLLVVARGEGTLSVSFATVKAAVLAAHETQEGGST